MELPAMKRITLALALLTGCGPELHDDMSVLTTVTPMKPDEEPGDGSTSDDGGSDDGSDESTGEPEAGTTGEGHGGSGGEMGGSTGDLEPVDEWCLAHGWPPGSEGCMCDVDPDCLGELVCLDGYCS